MTKREGSEDSIVIYMDVFWIVNCCMNSVILMLLGKILHIHVPVYRMILAGGAGGIGACITILFVDMPLFIRFLFLYVAVSTLMIRIAFPYRGILPLFITVAQFYIVAFLVGGMFSFLYYQMNLRMFFMEKIKGNILENSSISFLVKGIVVGAIISPFFFVWKNRIKDQKNLLYEVELQLEGRKQIGTGLLDTGNQLREPILGNAVYLCEYDWIKSIFNQEQIEAVEHYQQLEIKENLPFPIYIIPFQSVGEKRGRLIGMKIDEMIIKNGHHRITKENAMIALYHGRFTKGREYQIILHQEIIEHLNCE